MKTKPFTAVLLPGFNGSADQPVLVSLAKALEAEGVRSERKAPPAGRPSPNLEAETRWLLDELKRVKGPVCVIGRSFGGRLALRASHLTELAGIALLGFPIRPPKKRRPEDERLLHGVTAPTLIVQGSIDDLGPLRVIEATVKNNEQVVTHVIKGAGHAFGRHEPEVVSRTVDFVLALRESM